MKYFHFIVLTKERVYDKLYYIITTHRTCKFNNCDDIEGEK